MATYWITGASSGIGEALALELNQEGHQVILSARNVSKLEEVKKKLPNQTAVKILPLDTSDTKSAKLKVTEAVEAFGKIDCLILNAGISQRSLVSETTFEVYRDLMEVNYFGNVALAQAMLEKFVAQDQGHFVVISSLVGKFGTPYRSGYSASKHALHGFFDSLRAEMMMDKKNIDVTIICPGFVATDISFNALGASGKATHTHDKANASGLSPAAFAKKALKVMNNKEYEAYIGGKEILGVKLKRFFPNAFARKIAKAVVR